MFPVTKSKFAPKPQYKGIKNFKVQKKTIGEGATGEVFGAIYKATNELYALKKIDK